MPMNLHILAAGDAVMGFLFFLIWVLVIAASGFQKWQQQQKKKREMGMPPVPPPMPGRSAGSLPSGPPAQRSTPLGPLQRREGTAGAARRPVAQRPGPKPQPGQQPPRRLPVPPLPRRPVAPVFVEQEQLPTSGAVGSGSAAGMQNEIGSAGEKSAGASARATTARIQRLLQRRSLRDQILVAELLKSPLALRQEGDRI
jgi:hypothetical protein